MATTGFEHVKTAKVHGTTLAYREEGQGEPVVFVHGTGSDLRIWEQQLPVIGRDYRAIAYSRRYARPNEDIDRDADDPILRHVEDLAAFLSEIGAVPSHLVGSSWGAFISLLLVIRHPELVRTLVLEEPPAMTLFVSVPPKPAELLRLFATRPRTGIAILRAVAGTLAPATRAFERGDDEEGARIFLTGVLGKASYDRLSETSRERKLENLGSARVAMLRPGFAPLSDDEVRGIRVPVLLVTGEHSPAFLLRLSDRLEELLPDVERVEISDASHVMHEENAPAVNEAILSFLGRHRDR